MSSNASPSDCDSSAIPATSGTLHNSDDAATWSHRFTLPIFFACLCVLYFILRCTARSGDWPTRSDLRINVRWASLGTLLLICSGFSLELATHAVRRARTNASRYSIFITLILGLAFLSFQALAYRSLGSHNLIPSFMFGGLYSRADVCYLSAVNQRLADIANKINTDTVRQNQLAELVPKQVGRTSPEPEWADELLSLRAAESQRAARLVLVNRLLSSHTKWTAAVVGNSSDTLEQRSAMIALAHDIYPIEAYVAMHQQYRRHEATELAHRLMQAVEQLAIAQRSTHAQRARLQPLQVAVESLRAEQKRLSKQLPELPLIPDHNEQVAATEKSLKSYDKALAMELAEVQQRFEEAMANVTATAIDLGDAEDAESQSSQEIARLRNRQAIVDEIDRLRGGLNEEYPWLRLPVSIPGGIKWMLSYVLLTAVHAICVVFGWLAMGKIFLFQLRDEPPDSNAVAAEIFNIRLYWHLVVGVWVLLCVLIYWV